MKDEQPDVAHGLFGPGIFGSGVDLSALDDATAFRLGALVGQMIQAAVKADREGRSQFASRSRVVTWDWREQPSIEDLRQAIAWASDDEVHIYEVKTGNDEYAVVISNGTFGKAEVDEIYQDWLGG